MNILRPGSFSLRARAPGSPPPDPGGLIPFADPFDGSQAGQYIILEGTPDFTDGGLYSADEGNITVARNIGQGLGFEMLFALKKAPTGGDVITVFFGVDAMFASGYVVRAWAGGWEIGKWSGDPSVPANWQTLDFSSGEPTIAGCRLVVPPPNAGDIEFYRGGIKVASTSDAQFRDASHPFMGLNLGGTYGILVHPDEGAFVVRGL